MAERRDVQRNRARILAAAVEVFREHGANAPLDLVARGADVGRATLYRHHPDRSSLIAAVLETRVDTLERYAETYPGDDLLERLLVEICWFQVDLPGLVPALRAAPEQSRLDDVVQRTQRLLARAVQQGHRAGTVLPDIEVSDVFLVIAMVDGAISALATSPEPVDVARALELVVPRLRPAGLADRPVPEPELRPSTSGAAPVDPAADVDDQPDA